MGEFENGLSCNGCVQCMQKENCTIYQFFEEGKSTSGRFSDGFREVRNHFWGSFGRILSVFLYFFQYLSNLPTNFSIVPNSIEAVFLNSTGYDTPHTTPTALALCEGMEGIKWITGCYCKYTLRRSFQFVVTTKRPHSVLVDLVTLDSGHQGASLSFAS